MPTLGSVWGESVEILGAAVDAFCDESSDDDVVIQNVRRTALKLLATSLQGLGGFRS